MSLFLRILEPYMELYALLWFVSVIPLVVAVALLCRSIYRMIRRSHQRAPWRNYRGVVVWTLIFFAFQLPSFVVRAELKGRAIGDSRRFESPDGSEYILAQLHLTYPRTEFLDPRVLFEVRLFDSRLEERSSLGRVVISEESDFLWPSVEWTDTEVILTAF